MDRVPHFRAAHLHPYLRLLDKLGAPVDKKLIETKLPGGLRDDPDAQLSLLRALDFLTLMAKKQGIDDIALRANEYFAITELSPEYVQQILLAPSLKVALESFFTLARLEDAQLRIWAEKHGEHIHVCSREEVVLGALETRHCEMNNNAALVAIVQAFVGAGWLPAEMGFHSSVPLGTYVQQSFPNTALYIGQPSAWVSIPEKLLASTLHHVTFEMIRRFEQDGQTDLGASTLSGFNESFKNILKPYLGDGIPPITLAAEIAGVSVRTLQRCLSDNSTSYSKLVQCAQYELASHLLKDPSARVLDIGFATGYEDPSNFTRAFRRYSGMTPKQYRELALVG